MTHGIEWLDRGVQDLRYACRLLVKHRGFTAVAIITLALGIGATTAIFSVVYSVLLEPLPYAEPGQIYSAEIVIPERRAQIPSFPASVQAYLQWRDASTDFTAMTALRPWESNVTGDGDPERLGGARVSANFFSFLGVPIAHGRGFSAEEEQQGNERVVVISESLARRLWSGEMPAAIVGRQFRQGDVQQPLVTVAGVVEDARPGALDREPPPVVYRPYDQWASGAMTLVVRTAGDPTALAPSLRTVIRTLDPNLPILAIRSMQEIVSSTVAERQFQMTLTSLFAVLAVVLGAVGLYGVVSYSVTSSTLEIGLRMALGALRIDVMRWVFSYGMQPVVLGLLAGLAAAIAVARAVRSLLFGVTPTDPLTLGAVALGLLLTSGLACYLPARRAAALDPTTALRHQ